MYSNYKKFCFSFGLIFFQMVFLTPLTFAADKWQAGEGENLPLHLSDLISKTKVYAIHLTDTAPHEAIMVPGKRNGQKIDETFGEMRPDARPTLHWSLGGFPDSDALNLKEKSFAILVPLSDLEEQLLSISAIEIITIGHLNLTYNSIVLVPNQMKVSLNLGLNKLVQIYYYDKGPNHNMYEQLDTLIGKLDIPKIQFSNFYYDAEAHFKGFKENINTPEFFLDILQRTKASFGNNMFTIKGKASSVGYVDYGVRYLAESILLRNEYLPTSYMSILLKLTQWHKERAFKEIIQRFSKKEVLTIFEDKMLHASHWFDLASTEIILRTKHQKTLKGLDPNKLKGLWGKGTNDGIIAQTLELTLEQHKESEANSFQELFCALYMGFLPLNIEEADALAKELEQEGLNYSTLKTLHAFLNLTRSYQDLPQESLTEILNISFPQINQHDNISLHIIACMFVEPKNQILFGSNLKDKIETIYSMPIIKTNFQRMFPEELSFEDPYYAPLLV